MNPEPPTALPTNISTVLPGFDSLQDPRLSAEISAVKKGLLICQAQALGKRLRRMGERLDIPNLARMGTDLISAADPFHISRFLSILAQLLN